MISRNLSFDNFDISVLSKEGGEDNWQHERQDVRMLAHGDNSTLTDIDDDSVK